MDTKDTKAGNVEKTVHEVQEQSEQALTFVSIVSFVFNESLNHVKFSSAARELGRLLTERPGDLL
jgi:hypothetical protein